MTRAEAKYKARQRLGGNIFSGDWIRAAIVVGIFYVLGIWIKAVGMENIEILGNIISVFTLGPLSYGLYLIFLKKSKDGEQIKIADVFKGFSEDLAGNFMLNLMINIFIALWSLLFVIPGIVKYYAYSMAFLVKADHPEYGWKQCLDESKRITDGHKMELFLLDMSMIGWRILGSICLGIGSFWVSAYSIAAKTEYYRAWTEDGLFEQK